MTSFDIKIDPRDAQYGRFASAILRTLRSAVYHRVGVNHTQRDIADRLGWHRSQLSRVLNGRINNISIKTVSDILWACDFEPEEFAADPVEKLSPNHHCYFTEHLTAHVVPAKNNVRVFEFNLDSGVSSNRHRVGANV